MCQNLLVLPGGFIGYNDDLENGVGFSAADGSMKGM